MHQVRSDAFGRGYFIRPARMEGRTIQNHTVSFPISQLRTEPRGFEALAQLHSELSQFSSHKLAVDCSKLYWFDAHLAAPFMTVVEHGRSHGNTVQLSGLTPSVALILKKNGLLTDKATDQYRTTIPVTLFQLDEEVRFADYSRKHLARREMPRMSVALKRKFFEGIDELFANCALHSQSIVNVVAAGQFFPRTYRLAFAISDGGRGVDGSLRDSRVAYTTAADAIDWAMQSNNTTRQGDIPGGLGLKILRDFVGKNGGKLTIASGAGWWCQNGVQVNKSTLRYPFPGTSVILEVLTSDTKRYDLAPSPTEIW